jgi:hypothetical protein
MCSDGAWQPHPYDLAVCSPHGFSLEVAPPRCLWLSMTDIEHSWYLQHPGVSISVYASTSQLHTFLEAAYKILDWHTLPGLPSLPFKCC